MEQMKKDPMLLYVPGYEGRIKQTKRIALRVLRAVDSQLTLLGEPSPEDVAIGNF